MAPRKSSDQEATNDRRAGNPEEARRTPPGSGPDADTNPEDGGKGRAESREIEDLLVDTYEHLRRAAGYVSGHTTDTFDKARTFVDKHPGASLLGSFMIGVVLGLLASRK